MRNVRRVIWMMVVILSVANVASADLFGTGDNQFTIDFVNISGDASSANGTYIGESNPEGFTDPANDYRMGTYEITNDQWDKFVNSYGTVTGSPSNAYNEGPHFGGTDIPTDGVSWYEAAQFVNYLNTSSGHQAAYKFTGTQGTGDYTLGVWESGDAGYDDSTNPYRNSNAYYFLPTDNEWVKAAYWNGTNLQTYATTDDSVPVAGVETNFNDALGQPWNVGSGSEELNGTFDMMGNVWEWNETLFYSSYRGIRGGSCYLQPPPSTIASSRGDYDWLHAEPATQGFRVASVPEPTIDSIINFIFDAVDANSLQGEGTGNSADNKLNAFISKIDTAAFLIDAGDPDSIVEACGELQAAYKKCDGLKSPKDFVSGDATEELANMILALIEELGCE